jgi:hypothetical protein
MIIKCLSELLLDHECVIVPEMGAFISKEMPAMLDYVTGRLTPPSKEVAFNGQIVTDDGLFIGYLAERMGVTKTVAAKMVHDFAMRSLSVLETSGALRLDGMGVLTRVSDRDFRIQFDDDTNLLGDSFGLTTIKAQPIYRKETYHQLANQIATEQKVKNTIMTVHEETQISKPHHVNRQNYKWFRAAAYSMMIAMVLVLLGWGADRHDSSFASWNPFFYSSPNEFIAKHLGEAMGSREFVQVDVLVSVKASVVDCDCDVKYIEPVGYEQLKPVDTRVYYIIGSSLTSEKEAQKCVTNFQKQSFDNAVALPVNAKGNIRVAYDMVMGYDIALKRLEIIKKDYNESAWLLRKQ